MRPCGEWANLPKVYRDGQEDIFNGLLAALAAHAPRLTNRPLQEFDRGGRPERDTARLRGAGDRRAQPNCATATVVQVLGLLTELRRFADNSA